MQFLFFRRRAVGVKSLKAAKKLLRTCKITTFKLSTDLATRLVRTDTPQAMILPAEKLKSSLQRLIYGIT